MAKYKELIVFQKADELAFKIYKASESFPKSEMFGLTSQIKRAALSIPQILSRAMRGKARKN